MKKFLSNLILILALIFSTLSPSNYVLAKEENQGQEVKTRVMSYNIHFGQDMKNVYNIDKIAETIRESGAEIIGLQEVDVNWDKRSNFDDEIKYLAEKLNMNYFYAPIYNLDPFNAGEPRRQFGVAVLTTYPILNASNDDIARLSTQVPNPTPQPAPGFADVLINVKGVHVPVYVTHLDYRANPYVREMQVNDMLKIISENHREQKILIGDMNAKPTAPELAPLFKEFNDAVAMVNNTPCYTFPADNPNSRIDYVLTTPAIKVLSSHVINTLTSDHRPVVVDVSLSRGRQNEPK